LDIHSAVQLTDATIAKIKQASVLAPLHNPPGLQGIEAALKVFGQVPQVRTLSLAMGCLALPFCVWSCSPLVS
jgi:acetate kinase